MTEDNLDTISSPGGDHQHGSIRILHLHGSLGGTSFTAPSGSLNLGRKADLEIAFDSRQDFLVSGIHARIFRVDGGAWQIEDVGSTNGSAVNGESLAGARRLHSGDVVTLGSTDDVDGAVSFRVDIDGEPRPAAARRVAPSVSPFRGDPSVPARAPDSGPPAPPVPRHPALGGTPSAGPVLPHPMQGPGTAPTPQDEGGFLGIKRIKGAISRFMDRRELQKQLDADRARLPLARSSAEDGSRALGLQLWKDQRAVGEQLKAASGLAAFDRERASLEADLVAERTSLEEARAAFERESEIWRRSHDELEATAVERATQASDVERQAAEAGEAVTHALADRVSSLELARKTLDDFLLKHEDPQPDVVADLEGLGATVRAAAECCESPVPGLAQLIDERDKLRERAVEARQASDEAGRAVEQSLAEHEAGVAQLAARERDLAQAESAHGQHVEQLERRYSAAFAALGSEAALSERDAIRTLGTHTAAAAAVRSLRALEERIAQAEAHLAQLS